MVASSVAKSDNGSEDYARRRAVIEKGLALSTRLPPGATARTTTSSGQIIVQRGTSSGTETLISEPAKSLTSRQEFVSSLYTRMGYQPRIDGGTVTAVKPGEVITISGRDVLTERGKTAGTAKFYPENVPRMEAKMAAKSESDRIRAETQQAQQQEQKAIAIPASTYTATPKIEWWDFPAKLERQMQMKGTPQWATATGVAVAITLKPIFHPIQTGKGIWESVTHPKETYTSTKEYLAELGPRLRTDTGQAVGEVGGFVGQTYVIGKIGGRIGEGGKTVLKKGAEYKYAINQKPLFNRILPIQKTGVKLVEDVTIPRKLSYLRSFEGKEKVPVVHTTYAKLTPNVIDKVLGKGDIEIKPSAWEKLAPGFRKSVGQRSFYTSAPEKIDGKVSPKYEPVAYGGYIGMGKGDGYSLKSEFSLLPKTGKAYIFRETTIGKLPKGIESWSPKKILEYQNRYPGTYPAMENILKKSTEGQFTTSPGTEAISLFKISKVEGPLKGKSSFYTIRKPVPHILGGDKSSIPVRTLWNALTRKTSRIKFYETAFKPTGKSVPPTRAKAMSLPELQKFSSEISGGKSLLGSASRGVISVAAASKFLSFESSFKIPSSTSISKIFSSASVSKSLSKISSVSSVKSSPSKASSTKSILSSGSSLSKSLSKISSGISNADSKSTSQISSSISKSSSKGSSFKTSFSMPKSIMSIPRISGEAWHKKKKISFLRPMKMTKYRPSIVAKEFGIKRGKQAKFETGVNIREMLR